MSSSLPVTSVPFPSKCVSIPGARARLEKYAIVPEPTTRLDDQMVFLWSPPPWTIADAKEHIVEGYASLPSLDDQGDIIPIDVIADALPEFMKWANGRAMHGKIAAGKILKATVDDKGVWITYKVTDPTEWVKCETATYQGFSIGGDVTKLERRPDGVRVITGLRINEISLVDRPANQDAKIYVMKAHGNDPLIEKYSLSKAAKCEKHDKENCEECGCDRTVGHPSGTITTEAERPGEVQSTEEKAADLSRERARAGRAEYGDVKYADPAHNKYPIDTEKHIRAAWSYINMPKNQSGYSSGQLSAIKGRIKAAARAHGIKISEDKATKGNLTMTLEKVRALLDDPADLAVVDSFEKLLVSKGATDEWHTQSDVGDIDSKTRSGVTYENEDDDIGDEELPLDDFLKAVADSEEEDKKDQEDDQTEKASAAGSPFKECFSHAKALAGHFQKLSKAMSDGGDTEACKGHLGKCKSAFVKLHKALTKAQKAHKGMAEKVARASFEKVYRPNGNGLSYRQLDQFERTIEKTIDNKIEEAVLPLINRLKRLQNFIAGLPISKVQSRSHLEVISKDDEKTSALDATKRAMGISR